METISASYLLGRGKAMAPARPCCRRAAGPKMVKRHRAIGASPRHHAVIYCKFEPVWAQQRPPCHSLLAS